MKFYKVTNGTLERNAEEYHRLLQKPQNTVDWIKSNRCSGSKAVVSPLPGSESSSQAPGEKKQKSNETKSNEHIESDNTALASEIKDDYTDVN